MKEYAHEFAEFKYRMPSRLERSGGLWLIRMGRNRAKSSYKVGPKTIECYSLHLVIAGRLRVAASEEEFVLEEGDAFCLFPHSVCHYEIAEEEGRGQGSPLALVWAAFDGPQAPRLLEAAGLTPERPVVRGEARHKKVPLAAWEALFEAVEEGEPGPDGLAYDLRIQSLLYAFLARLFASSRLQERPWSGHSRKTADLSPGSGLEGKLLEAEAYLKLHYREAITIREAAEHVGLNRTYFSMRFAERIGVSPRDYLQRLRMEEARRQLRSTAKPITEIALSVGYPDVYGFSRAFAREHGMPPGAYRQSES